jgi:hypothetical protein
VFKALRRDNHVPPIVDVVKKLPRAYAIHTGAFEEIHSDVFFSVKKISDRPINIQAADL